MYGEEMAGQCISKLIYVKPLWKMGKMKETAHKFLPAYCTKT